MHEIGTVDFEGLWQTIGCPHIRITSNKIVAVLVFFKPVQKPRNLVHNWLRWDSFSAWSPLSCLIRTNHRIHRSGTKTKTVPHWMILRYGVTIFPFSGSCPTDFLRFNHVGLRCSLLDLFSVLAIIYIKNVVNQERMRRCNLNKRYSFYKSRSLGEEHVDRITAKSSWLFCFFTNIAGLLESQLKDDLMNKWPTQFDAIPCLPYNYFG